MAVIGSGDLARAVDRLLDNVEKSWAAGDADALTAQFRPDADFVDVLGRRFRGKEAIASIHRRNFASIHLNSRLRLARLATRELAPGVAIAHVGASLHVPAGPLAGDTRSTQTWILVEDGDAWLITAFHNTYVRDIPYAPQAH